MWHVIKSSCKWFLALILVAGALENYCQTPPGSKFPEIRIQISKSQYGTLLQSKGQKTILKNPQMLFNGDTAVVKEIHSRGNNSLTFEHKSLSVELDKNVSVRRSGEKVKLKKFDLMNLVMDKNLWHNRWAFLHMSQFSVFPLFNIYCTLWINDQPQGIYLLVEKPRHYTNSINSPYMIRRGIDHTIQDEYIDTPSKDESKKFKKQYLSLYEDIGKYEGEELYNRLQAKLHLEHYFEWLAFNYLIMNGDYADELYLYILPASGQFDILPWDYDDILRPNPHEGNQTRNSIASLKNKLIFSSEDPLDRAIGSDEFIYRHYLEAFRKLLTTLTPEMINGISDRVKEELESVSNAETSKASLFLGKDPFQIDQARQDMRVGLDFILARRNALLKELH